MDLGLERWTDFNVALVGATAALAGLVIVAASVNVAEIVKSSSLTARLAAAIANLMVALTSAAVGLMPDVAGHGYGITLVLLAAGAIAFHIHAVRQIYSTPTPQIGVLKHAQAVLGFVPPLGFAVGGVLVIAGDPFGLAAFALASILAVGYTLGISWVALIEVLR